MLTVADRTYSNPVSRGHLVGNFNGNCDEDSSHGGLRAGRAKEWRLQLIDSTGTCHRIERAGCVTHVDARHASLQPEPFSRQ
jgi:hypothetical protein